MIFQICRPLLRSKYNRNFIEVDNFAYFNKASMPRGLAALKAGQQLLKL
jgi:hypothetical protein